MSFIEIVDDDNTSNDLDTIARLARHEFFDENLEGIHAVLSKRDSIRQSLNSSMSSVRRNDSNSKGEGEERVDDRKNSGVDKAYKRSSRSLVLDLEKEKQPQRRRNHNCQRQYMRSSTAESPPNEHRHRRPPSRRKILQQDDHQRSHSINERPVRTDSVIEKLLQYDKVGSDSVTKNGENNSNSSLVSNPSTSRDSVERQSGSYSKTDSCIRKDQMQRQRSRSNSTSRMLKNGDDPQHELRQQHRRRGSSLHPQQESRNNHRQRSSSQQKHQVHKTPVDDDQNSHHKKHQHQLRRGHIEENEIEQYLEQNHTTKSKHNGIDTSLTLSPVRLDKIKKTKLEKIHELLAKCDRYKKEWKDVVVELRKCRRELEENCVEVILLKKNIETSERETKKLQTKFSQVSNELETIENEQRKDRTKLSNTTKELATANLDHAKSVDEVRTLKSEVDRLREILTDRDETICTLEEELRSSVENTKHLEADVLYADDQIVKLEQEMKSLEEEVAEFRKAAEQDFTSDVTGDGNRQHLREAMDEATKRLYEQKERDINEKRITLDEQIEEFEEQRKQYLEDYKQKEEYFLNQQTNESKKQEIFEEERRENERKISHRLKTLEDENTALNGRLKSEQLDSTMKFKNKDNVIVELQTKLALLTSQQKVRDNATEEIGTLKANIESRQKKFEGVQMEKIELQNEVNDLQLANKEMVDCMSALKIELANGRKEVDNHKRKTIEWQKKSGEWSDKAFKWKGKAEQWENKAKEFDPAEKSTSSAIVDTAKADPQALFLAAAVEKKAVTTMSSRWGGIFNKSENEDETQFLINKLEKRNSEQEIQIKTMKSEMVKILSKYKEESYSKKQECDNLLKEKEAIELINTNLLKELDLARKLNQIISNSN